MKTTTILDAIHTEERVEGAFTVTSFSPSGESHLKAVVDAVIDDYHTVIGVAEVTSEALMELASKRAKATLLMTGENMLGSPGIYATEASLYPARDGVRVALLPKGARSKGFILTGKVLDVVEGYGKIGVLRDRVEKVRDSLPPVVELTKADLEALPAPNGSDRSPPATLAVFGTWRMPDGDSPGAVWVLTEYDAENDIADGVLFIREADGYSEHGSVYGEQLLAGRFGKVAGFAGMTFKEAVDFTSGAYSDAVEAVKAAVSA